MPETKVASVGDSVMAVSKVSADVFFIPEGTVTSVGYRSVDVQPKGHTTPFRLPLSEFVVTVITPPRPEWDELKTGSVILWRGWWPYIKGDDSHWHNAGNLQTSSYTWEELVSKFGTARPTVCYSHSTSF